MSDTVLGRAPVKSGFVLTATGLTLLFTLMEPESSAALGFFERLMFWALQITTALLGLMFASFLVSHIAHKRLPVSVSLFISGIVGAVLVAPVFASIDYWFPGLKDEPDGWLDMLEQQGPAFHVVSEFLEIAPGLITIWFLINIPLLLNVTYKLPTDSDDPPPPEQPPSTAKQVDVREKLRNDFYERLPEALSKDIVSISSELHYVNVKMTDGKALILGALNQIAEALDDDGVLIHRSHWVHKKHVVSVHISGSQAWCEMSNGERLPISRSKRKLVKSYFGNEPRRDTTKGKAGLTRVK
ncbi:LytTR family transcriptional regulator [Salinimonas sp. HHU 13199]|uniref:LytTR family transcriptional regulator n=1 Tax=Salinimonas profundi TaxID=2729140 RepID=A0ABR8LLD2_9ALTE|nr:LytTR family DNA-binding domain-containing protein [Salinimonas profundi]MBD3584900.1 LytTR family transcriptional regulator [Salinimonas profundi]